MTASESPMTYSAIVRMISKGDKEQVFAHIPNKTVKDFISECLMDDPADRPKISELLQHKFLTSLTEDDNKPLKVKTEFIQSKILKKHRTVRKLGKGKRLDSSKKLK